jgi:hypothetical protein
MVSLANVSALVSSRALGVCYRSRLRLGFHTVFGACPWMLTRVKEKGSLLGGSVFAVIITKFR